MFVYMDFGMDVITVFNKMGLFTEVNYYELGCNSDVVLVFHSQK